MDVRPLLSAAQDAFGVSALVLLPGETSAVDATVFWTGPQTAENPTDGGLTRAEPRRVLVLSRVEVPDVPRGTVITCAEYDGAADEDWRVEEAAKTDADHFRAVVVREP